MAAALAEIKIANPEIKESVVKSLRADHLKTDGTISSSPASVNAHLPEGTSEIFVSPATVKSLVHDDSGPIEALVATFVTNPIAKTIGEGIFITTAAAGAALLAARATDRNLKIDKHNTRLSRRAAIFAAGAGALTLIGTTAACALAPITGAKIPGLTEVPSTEDMTVRKRRPGDADLTEQDTAFMATFAAAFRNDNFSQGAQVTTLADGTQDTELVVIKSIDGKQTTVLNKVHAFRGDQELFFVQFLDANGTVQTTQVQDILQKQDENGNFVVSVRVKNAQNGTAIIEQQTWKNHWDLETADSNVLMSTVVFDPIRQLFYSSKKDAAILINSLVMATTATATETPKAVTSAPTAAPTATAKVEFTPTPDPIKAETIKSQDVMLKLAQTQGLKDVQVASFWNQKNGEEIKVASILQSSTDKTKAWILGADGKSLIEVKSLAGTDNFAWDYSVNLLRASQKDGSNVYYLPQNNTLLGIKIAPDANFEMVFDKTVKKNVVKINDTVFAWQDGQTWTFGVKTKQNDLQSITTKGLLDKFPDALIMPEEVKGKRLLFHLITSDGNEVASFLRGEFPFDMRVSVKWENLSKQNQLDVAKMFIEHYNYSNFPPDLQQQLLNGLIYWLDRLPDKLPTIDEIGLRGYVSDEDWKQYYNKNALLDSLIIVTYVKRIPGYTNYGRPESIELADAYSGDAMIAWFFKEALMLTVIRNISNIKDVSDPRIGYPENVSTSEVIAISMAMSKLGGNPGVDISNQQKKVRGEIPYPK